MNSMLKNEQGIMLGGIIAGIVLALSNAWSEVLRDVFDRAFGDDRDDFYAHLAYATFLTLLAYFVAKALKIFAP